MGVRRKPGESGNIIIEFAIGSSLFIALLVGTYQFGYTLFAFNNLQSAVRSGARYGSVTVYDAGVPTVNSSPASSFVTRVKNVTVYGDPAGAASGLGPVAAGLTPDHVRVDVAYTEGQPRMVTVSINGYRVPAIFGNWTAERKPSASFTYTGRYAPPHP